MVSLCRRCRGNGGHSHGLSCAVSRQSGAGHRLCCGRRHGGCRGSGRSRRHSRGSGRRHGGNGPGNIGMIWWRGSIKNPQMPWLVSSHAFIWNVRSCGNTKISPGIPINVQWDGLRSHGCCCWVDCGGLFRIARFCGDSVIPPEFTKHTAHISDFTY